MKSRKDRYGNLVLDYAIDAELELAASITPGCKATGPTYACGGTPEEPSEIEDLQCGVTIGGKYIDLLPLLDDSQRSTIEELIWQRAIDDRNGGYDE